MQGIYLTCKLTPSINFCLIVENSQIFTQELIVLYPHKKFYMSISIRLYTQPQVKELQITVYFYDVEKNEVKKHCS